MEYSFIAVEGPHDVEFLARILRLEGFQHTKNIRDVPEFWRPSIPRNFPLADGDMTRRMPIPSFFEIPGTHSVAIFACGGEHFSRAKLLLDQLSKEPGTGSIGIFSDNDSHRGGTGKIFSAIKQTFPELSFGNAPGEIKKGKPSTGIFLFPDNSNPGTLETLLLSCAERVYPTLFQGSRDFVEKVDVQSLPSDDISDFLSPSGRDKATVGCIGTILRPGKAIQMSIHDNHWVGPATIEIPEIARIRQFLRQLLNRDEPEHSS